MARTALLNDVFGAVAEPRRRAILDFLTGSERAVSDVVESLELPQPTVSKQLKILKEVGLVRMRREGRQRLYRTDGERLRPVYDWTKKYEHFWSHQLRRVKALAEAKARSRSGGKRSG